MKKFEFYFKAYCCLFYDKCFLEDLVQGDLDEELGSNQSLRESSHGKIQEAKIRLKEATMSKRNLLLKKMLLSFIWIFAAIVFASFVSCIIGKNYYSFGKIVTVLSVFCFSWATLARLGWEGQTIGGNSVFEKVDENIFWMLYFAGTLLAVISIMQ